MALCAYRTFAADGGAIRATAMDPEAAQQMGVDVSRVRSLVFGIAGLIGGIGGVMIGF